LNTEHSSIDVYC